MQKIQLLGLAVCAGLLFTACEKNDPQVEVKTAGFEDIILGEDTTSAHYATDSTYLWTSGGYGFNTTVAYSGTYFSNFVVSGQQSNAYATYADAYRSACGGAHNGSHFAVAYVDSYGEEQPTITCPGEVVKGCYITNNAYAYSSMMNGDTYARKFTADDWFLLTITGHNGEETTGKVDIYLAKNGIILKDWTYFSLETLGKVTSITFALSSSDSGQYGMNTPAYFCIDDVGAEK